MAARAGRSLSSQFQRARDLDRAARRGRAARQQALIDAERAEDTAEAGEVLFSSAHLLRDRRLIRPLPRLLQK
jgi:hypothetical protein